MDRFGRYTVFDCLGAGGMATVHRATIEVAGGVVREVALKRMLPQLADDQKTLEDFVREAKLAAQLNHPNIVRVLELGLTEDTYFIAMELVRGHSLLQLMKNMVARRDVAPVGIVVALLSELCDALDYATSTTDGDGLPMEIVHRDLSPSNLIIDTEGHLKIIDFGVAKSTRGQFVTSSGMVKGKLGYMALEVLAGKDVDKRSDIFSVGVVAWEMLSGRRLFAAPNEYEVINKIKKGAAAPPSHFNTEVSPELDEIVMHALSRRPDDRWPSAAVMKNALDTLRRVHRDGPREVNQWRKSLIPATELDGEDSTTKLKSLRDPGVHGHETQRMVMPDIGHYEIDDDDNIPTQMNEIPRPPRAASDHLGLITEPAQPAFPSISDTAFEAMPPPREGRGSNTFDEQRAQGSDNSRQPRDTILGHSREDDD